MFKRLANLGRGLLHATKEEEYRPSAPIGEQQLCVLLAILEEISHSCDDAKGEYPDRDSRERHLVGSAVADGHLAWLQCRQVIEWRHVDTTILERGDEDGVMDWVDNPSRPFFFDQVDDLTFAERQRWEKSDPLMAAHFERVKAWARHHNRRCWQTQPTPLTEQDLSWSDEEAQEWLTLLDNYRKERHA